MPDCDYCAGAGEVPESSTRYMTCPKCKGRGEIPADAMWIRFREPGVTRYHAVYTQWGGSHVTFCGRFAPLSAEATDDPPARCGCCVSRVAHPYLVPAKIQDLKHPPTRTLIGDLYAEAYGSGD